MHGKHSDLGQAILRIGLGILFLVAGLMKLLIPGGKGITEMLAGLGFPIAAFFAWVLIIVEILAGLGLLIGYKTKWASGLLGIVMIVAILTVQLKTFSQDFPAQMQFLKDLAILVGLISVFLGGPGRLCLDRKH